MKIEFFFVLAAVVKLNLFEEGKIHKKDHKIIKFQMIDGKLADNKFLVNL